MILSEIESPKGPMRLTSYILSRKWAPKKKKNSRGGGGGGGGGGGVKWENCGKGELFFLLLRNYVYYEEIEIDLNCCIRWLHAHWSLKTKKAQQD